VTLGFRAVSGDYSRGVVLINEQMATESTEPTENMEYSLKPISREWIECHGRVRSQQWKLLESIITTAGSEISLLIEMYLRKVLIMSFDSVGSVDSVAIYSGWCLSQVSYGSDHG
jgi:hypothetical protein